jgi:hypothetical protein
MDYKWKPAIGDPRNIKYCRTRSIKHDSLPGKTAATYSKSNENFDQSEQYSRIEEEDVNFIVPSGGFLD